jgi:hypothetical protein
VNGEFSIHSAPEQGTIVRATVPVKLEEVWRMSELPSTPASH